MRTAQIAPLFESVPPRLYGGTERVVSYLTEELIRQGHQVTLFASGDSITSAELVSCTSRALRLDPDVRDPIPHYTLMLDKVRERAADFDILHFHIDYLHFPPSRALNAFGWPQIDIDETEKEVRITAELAGLDEKDVSLEIANGVLSISGEKKSESEDKARRFSERYYGRFDRRIPLEDVDEDKVSAAFKNGVLTITVPKSAERRIAINRNG